MSIETKGLDSTIKNLRQVDADLSGEPMLQGMRDCTLLVTRDARKNASVFMGILRASILPEVRSAGNTIEGVVGSNLLYAPFVELGTRPHWAPLAPLLRWVELKFGVTGNEAYAIAKGVQKSIAARGTAPKPYLQPAFETNLAAIESKLGSAVSGIVQRGNS